MTFSANRDERFLTMPEARAAAQAYADADGFYYLIQTRDGNLFYVKPAFDPKKFGFDSNIYPVRATIKPGYKTIYLNDEELAHYERYIETEREAVEGPTFEGGIFKTPTEKGLLAKIRAALAGGGRREQELAARKAHNSYS